MKLTRKQINEGVKRFQAELDKTAPAIAKVIEEVVGKGETMTEELEELKGHGFERANLCSGCRGALRGSEGHYHTREAFGGGVAAICCACAGHLPGAKPAPPVDSELLEAMLAVVEGQERFRIGDVWKALGGPDSQWYAIQKLFQTSGRFEPVSKQFWRVRL